MGADAANVVRLTDALLDAGLDEAAIRAVMGENVLRLLAAALPASDFIERGARLVGSGSRAAMPRSRISGDQTS